LVTHSLAQARRVGDDAAFFFEGRLLESGLADRVLEAPETPKLRAWIAGKFG
jgi:phosphate transport system ATP-binding protein